MKKPTKFNGLIELVGNTPLLELRNFHSENGVRILVKAEYQNPSGSVKDRAAKAMLLDGIESRKLTKDKTIIDATSGNTGIAYAMFGASLGYRVKLTMPSNVTEERKKIMKAYGADIIETDPLEGIDGAYWECRRIVSENPEAYFYSDQYSNEQNWKAHYFGTAEEILSQTSGKITHFVAGTGTSGTFMGCTKKLKEINPEIKCLNMTPDSPFHGIEGVKHCSALLKEGFFDETVSDGRIEISTETAYRTARQLARHEGLFVGISSGANVAAALKLAENVPDGSVIVTVLCDGGYRYLSGNVWGD
ncbi:MAG: cysteine synthase family protein [Ruminococcus sp.]|nr:cysteine synthase family protein [Ruminococcus sp.]